MNKKVPVIQLWIWVTSAVSAPLAIYAGSASWEWSLIVGVICSAVCLVVCNLERVEYGKIIGLIQTLVLTVAAGAFSFGVSTCWETEDAMMPLTLIVLAVLSAVGGAERCSRVNCVLAWFLALLYIVSLTAGVPDLKLHWMKPTGQGNGLLITSFLLPAISLMIPHENGKAKWIVVTFPIFAAIIGLWCVGALSTGVIKEVEMPFYEYSKSLSLFGIARRFESLVSVALTIGMFSALCLLFSAAENTIRNGAVLSGIGSAIIVTQNVQINGWIISFLSVFAWILLPLVKNKINNRKNEKSA